MRIFFSVGEPSGDQHAAHLAVELRRRRPDVELVGFGGPLMREAGFRLSYQLTDLAVMGILKVLPLLWRFYRLVRQAAAEFRSQRPDAVVLVDFPGFNWWIARRAKKLGIPVYYYCPPQLWAWAPWRIRKMRRFVDHVFCGLPFEAEWYSERGVSAECVGHPFFDEIADKPLDASFLSAHRSHPGDPVRTVAILPGSRNGEVHANWPIQVRVMQELRRWIPDVRFLVASYKPTQREWCETYLADANLDLPVEFHVGRTSEIIEVADVALMVSGSVSLELLARRTPAVVLYHVDWVFYLAARLLVTCKFMSLPNLVAGRAVMPEFPLVGDASTGVEEMTGILARWLTEANERERIVAEMTALHQRTARTGASACVAASLLRRLEPSLPLTKAA